MWPLGFIEAVQSIKGGGGSADLNFEIVGGTVQPVDPVENTIWVNTDHAITHWVFDFEQPVAAAEGSVWFSISNKSVVSFNALRENGIYLYLGKAMQMVGGAWTNVKTLVYQNGEWSKGEKIIYDGAWRDGLGFANTTYSGQNQASYDNNANPIVVTAWGYTGVYVDAKVDVGGFSNLEVDMSLPSNCKWIYVSLSSDNSYYPDNNTTNAVAYKRLSGAMDRQVVSIPIDSVQTGSYYIKFHGGQNSNSSAWLTVYGIKLT